MNVNPLPDYFTPHEAVVRAYEGTDGYGRPVYADAVTVPCFVVDERRLVRDDTGAEVVSSTQVHCGFDIVAPPASLVTVWPGLAPEREAAVISAEHGAHETLPAFQTLNLE
ncbi:hypothetical protein UQW22_09900 [Isoptericola halotolerans]|uniref:hypothetical protein n=1 Tax=Isoptericola halotolerans TaxID=300560 RepID=UPI003890D5B7